MTYLDEVVLERLLDALEEIENDDDSFPPPPLDDDKYEVVLPSDNSRIEKIIGYANALLIRENGEPNFDAIDEFHKEHGYFVFPGERDRFGWLTACLQTDKGIIVFG